MGPLGAPLIVRAGPVLKHLGNFKGGTEYLESEPQNILGLVTAESPYCAIMRFVFLFLGGRLSNRRKLDLEGLQHGQCHVQLLTTSDSMISRSMLDSMATVFVRIA
jgi:hypothetical protein